MKWDSPHHRQMDTDGHSQVFLCIFFHMAVCHKGHHIPYDTFLGVHTANHMLQHMENTAFVKNVVHQHINIQAIDIYANYLLLHCKAFYTESGRMLLHTDFDIHHIFHCHGKLGHIYAHRKAFVHMFGCMHDPLYRYHTLS